MYMYTTLPPHTHTYMYPPMSSSARPVKRRRTEAHGIDYSPTSNSSFLYINGAPEDDGVATALSSARKQGLLCDAEVVSSDGGPSHPAHRVLLASRSEYMRALLECSDRFADSSERTIRLVDISSKAVENLLRWMYGESVELVSLDDAMDLTEAASRLQCTDLLALMANMLRTRVGLDNCILLWTLAERTGCDALADAAENVAARHFQDIIKNNDLLTSVSPELLLKLVQRSILPILKEDDILAAIISWAKVQTDHVLETHLEPLLSSVRYPFVSKESFTQKVENEPLLAKYGLCIHSIVANTAVEAKGGCKERVDEIPPPGIHNLKEGMMVRVTSDLGRLRNSTSYRWSPSREAIAGAWQVIDKVYRSCNQVKIGGFYWSPNAIESVEFAATCDCVTCKRGG